MSLRKSVAGAVVAALMGVASPGAFAKAPDTYDDLYKVKSKSFDQAYLLAGTDFRTYKQVMIDPPEVAFRKNWLRDYNSSQVSVSSRISETEAERILEMARAGVSEIYAGALAKGGYEITSAPGPDVLRVSIAVINLAINAPDVMAPGRSVSFAREAGQAKLVVEVRDSLSGALLGRAIDSRTIGYGAPYRRNSVTNRADFARAFKRWAKVSVDALDELKALSPIDAEGKPVR